MITSVYKIVRDKIDERKRENDELKLRAELQTVKRLIRAAEYAFNYAVEKEDIDRSIAVIADQRRKYSEIYAKLRDMAADR